VCPIAAVYPFAALCLLACSTDTSGLARRDPVAVAGAGGAGSGGGAVTGGSAGEAVAGGAGPQLPDLPGTGAIGLVHGIVDGGSLFACWGNPEAGPLAAEPAQPPGGLDYGTALELPTDWDLGAEERELTLFVGVASLWSGSTCAELAAAAIAGVDDDGADASVSDSGPPAPPFPLEPTVPRRSGSVRFAPGALRPGARYGLIAAGCSGPLVTEQTAACGEPDALFGGFSSLVLAEISSESVAGSNELGLQFVNASRAVARADLTLQGPSGPAGAPLGNDVPFGAVRPAQAAAVAEPVGLELHLQREQLSSYTQAWSDTLEARGDVGAVLGRNHLVAYVGPVPTGNVVGLAPPRFVLIGGR
jgi:hypothetical protein